MANKNVTQVANNQADENPSKAAHADALKSLRDIDMQVQDATESISALATAAKKMLSLKVSDLLTIASLLDQIHDISLSIQDAVNCEAERFGANYIDTDRSELMGTLWAQERASTRTTSIEVFHG
jgi:hypothetical protein